VHNSVYKPLLVEGCGGHHLWLPCGNSTTKRFGHATAHTRGRWQQTQKKMNHIKLTFFTILPLVAFISCTNKLTDADFESKALKIIESLDSSKIELFKTWNYTPRGPNGIWFRMQADTDLYRCFYFDYMDSTELTIYGFNNFIKDYLPGFQPINIDDRIEIINQKGIVKIIGINSLGHDTMLLINELENSIFTSNNPFKDLKQVSDLKNSLGIVAVHFYSKLGGIFQFYLSTQHVLTYIPRMDMIDPQYKQEWLKDFKSGKILRENWSLKKLEEPIDFN
jgi:hypothetical protein